MPPRTKPEIEQAIIADIKSDKYSTREIAKRHDVSISTVSKIGKQVPNAFERASTKKALTARNVDMKAQRAQLAQDLLDDAQRLRDRAWGQYTYYERGVQGPCLVTLDQPPLGEVRNAYTSIGIVLDKHDKIMQGDRDPHGLAAVDSWLRSITGQ